MTHYMPLLIAVTRAQTPPCDVMLDESGFRSVSACQMTLCVERSIRVKNTYVACVSG